MMLKQIAVAKPKAVAIALPTPDALTIEARKWFSDVFASPNAGDIRIQAAPDNSLVKATIHLSLPLQRPLLTKSPALPVAIHHLNVNLDVSKIVTFHENGGETVYVLPNEANVFPVTIKNDKPTFTDEQRKALSETYRGYMTYALQAIKHFPDIDTLDIDVYGQLDRSSTELSQIISCNNMSIFSCIQDLETPPKLQNLTIQTGYNLDVWRMPNNLIAVYMLNTATPPAGGQAQVHTIDTSDLTAVRDHLRDEKGTRIVVALQGPHGDGWEPATRAEILAHSRLGASAKPKVAAARKIGGVRRKKKKGRGGKGKEGVVGEESEMEQ